ncbi:hypothetical protein K443DRAFT_12045 [Laccaria amethystina LaAM-08-1]|uniref:Uncharacterized protein n=1 Tax=Laccaria amethystina LaAM-08-1 TaxID=1095629 RepID=A0A0C9WJD9_9AGAR|nr:hypothetical protein K443DRAFT_12045 [Laccaria amethystina LaAM-08-1]
MTFRVQRGQWGIKSTSQSVVTSEQSLTSLSNHLFTFVDFSSRSLHKKNAIQSLSLLALLAVLAAASPVPQQQVPGVVGPTTGGVVTTAGEILVIGELLPGSVMASAIKAAGGTPGSEAENASDDVVGLASKTSCKGIHTGLC